MTLKEQLSGTIGTGPKNTKVALAQLALTIKQTIPINNIAVATAVGSDLKLVINDEEVILSVGAHSADFIAKKINIRNRTLSQKLGIGPSKRVLLVGSPETANFFEGLSAYAAGTVDDASVCLIFAPSIDALDELISIYDLLGAHLPIWVIYNQDKNVSLDDSVSRRMRELYFLRRRSFRINNVLSAALFKKRVQNINTPRFASK